MACKIMFIKRSNPPAERRRFQAWSLVEMMVGVSVFSLTGLALASLSLFGVRGFTTLANYAVLDQYNRQAMDQFTYELRQCKYIVNYTSNATSRSIIVNNS